MKNFLHSMISRFLYPLLYGIICILAWLDVRATSTDGAMIINKAQWHITITFMMGQVVSDHVGSRLEVGERWGKSTKNAVPSTFKRNLGCCRKLLYFLR